jgi:hypothetical protein
LTIAVSGTNATAMLASDPLPVATWLKNFEDKVATLKGEDKQKDATTKIDTAKSALAELDPEADKLAAAQAGGGKPPEKTEADVEADQRKLRDALAAVFKAFKGKDAAIIGIFAAEIDKAHDDAKLQLRKALRENETTFQTMKWAEIRAQVTEKYAPFDKPILAEHAFGKKAQAAATTLVPAGTVFVTPEQEATFIGQWVARLIHSEGGVFASALTALRTILFEGGKLEDSAELKAAVAEAFKRQQESGEQPDPDLVAEVSGKIIPFLVAVARGDATFGTLVLQHWDTVYWGKAANQAWLKDRFRGAAGHHEWVPTNYIDRVITKGRASARSDDLETAAAWITFQDELRSPTNLVMYPPTGRYARTAPHPRDAASRERQPGGALTVIQGHVGAVWAPLDESGYRDDVIAQTQAQGPWHDGLRKIFDSNPGTDMHTMRRVVQELLVFVADNCWFGEAVPGGVFNEYYANAKGEADGKDLVAFSTLQTRAASAIDLIDQDFDRARAAVGL